MNNLKYGYSKTGGVKLLIQECLTRHASGNLSVLIFKMHFIVFCKLNVLLFACLPFFPIDFLVSFIVSLCKPFKLSS